MILSAVTSLQDVESAMGKSETIYLTNFLHLGVWPLDIKL